MDKCNTATSGRATEHLPQRMLACGRQAVRNGRVVVEFGARLRARRRGDAPAGHKPAEAVLHHCLRRAADPALRSLCAAPLRLRCAALLPPTLMRRAHNSDACGTRARREQQFQHAGRAQTRLARSPSPVTCRTACSAASDALAPLPPIAGARPTVFPASAPRPQARPTRAAIPLKAPPPQPPPKPTRSSSSSTTPNRPAPARLRAARKPFDEPRPTRLSDLPIAGRTHPPPGNQSDRTAIQRALA
ncbi:hypothetical protein B0J12DRAFT_147900 [Macrophomina phaseolina]|uniref:Uncharacterized protein n=1 Tax=Macrophomina phaseolina TaxID=35725 RepID=A0ABQ8G681_9PEZI|nr:hypothetical protein B0J12DRAFT_147900 [Macrophomina phaseolina]